MLRGGGEVPSGIPQLPIKELAVRSACLEHAFDRGHSVCPVRCLRSTIYFIEANIITIS